MSCKCARKCMICYVNYPIFPGNDTHGTPSCTYPHIGGCTRRPGRRSSARHPMLNTNRRPCVQQLVHRSTVGVRAFPVAGPQLWNTLPFEVTSAPSMEIFCGADDWRPTYSCSHTRPNTCTYLCFTAFLFYLLYYSGPCSIFLLSSLFETLFDWLNDWLKQTLVFVRCGWCWSNLSWWTGLTSSCYRLQGEVRRVHHD